MTIDYKAKYLKYKKKYIVLKNAEKTSVIPVQLGGSLNIWISDEQNQIVKDTIEGMNIIKIKYQNLMTSEDYTYIVRFDDFTKSVGVLIDEILNFTNAETSYPEVIEILENVKVAMETFRVYVNTCITDIQQNPVLILLVAQNQQARISADAVIYRLTTYSTRKLDVQIKMINDLKQSLILQKSLYKDFGPILTEMEVLDLDIKDRHDQIGYGEFLHSLPVQHEEIATLLDLSDHNIQGFDEQFSAVDNELKTMDSPPDNNPILEELKLLDKDYLPSSFNCPITGEPMKEPVIDPTDGITYEKTALEQRYRDANTALPTLIPNKAVETAIEQLTEMGDEKIIPEVFKCILIAKIMEDPLIDPIGDTYEGTAIRDWLTANGTSPFTGNSLSLTDLIPNIAIQEAINEMKIILLDEFDEIRDMIMADNVSFINEKVDLMLDIQTSQLENINIPKKEMIELIIKIQDKILLMIKIFNIIVNKVFPMIEKLFYRIAFFVMNIEEFESYILIDVIGPLNNILADTDLQNLLILSGNNEELVTFHDAVTSCMDTLSQTDLTSHKSKMEELLKVRELKHEVHNQIEDNKKFLVEFYKRVNDLFGVLIKTEGEKIDETILEDIDKYRADFATWKDRNTIIEEIVAESYERIKNLYRSRWTN